jgi:hypothetical protein
MNAKRAFFAMLGGIILLVGLCAVGTYFAYKKITAEGSTLMGLKLESAILEKQSGALAQAKKDIAKYEELESIAKTVVPQEKDQARTTLEILNSAQESGISISGVEFPESLLGEAAKKTTKSSTSKTPAKTVDSNTTQLTPLEGLKGVYTMEIRVQSDQNQPIAYQQLLDYLRRLEKNRRTAQVRDITILPSSTNRNLVSFTLVLNSYVKP